MKMEFIKAFLLLGCFTHQGFAKPTETEEEPNDVQVGVAAVVEAIDVIITNAQGVKVMRMADAATELLEEVKEFDVILDELLLEESKGKYAGRRIPDIIIHRPKGSPESTLTMEDWFIAKLVKSLKTFKQTMVGLADDFDPDGPSNVVLKYYRVLKQVLWGVKQVGVALKKVAIYAEKDLEEMILEEALLEKGVDIEQLLTELKEAAI